MSRARRPIRNELFTIGHSTHALLDLVGLLERHGVTCVADVRRVPRSRRMPHLTGDSLSRRLPQHGIEYVHLPELGGWRKPVADSPNGGWRVEAFQGYADHMASAEFAAALERLVELGDAKRTAVMCAEGDWRRCHRRLVSDALQARGIDVVHIRPDGHTEMHELTPFARVSAGQVTYPPEQEALDI